MKNEDIVRFELPHIARIVRVAASRETSRRGHPVSTHDPEVQQRAAAFILSRAGRILRERYERRS